MAADLPDPLMLTDASTPSVALLEKALEKRASALFIGENHFVNRYSRY